MGKALLALMANLAMAQISRAQAPARDIYDDRAVLEDIRVLNDRHAASGVKLGACRRLGMVTESVFLREAVVALTRQMQYDAEPVREAALVAFQRLRPLVWGRFDAVAVGEMKAAEGAALARQIAAMGLGTVVQAHAEVLLSEKAPAWERMRAFAAIELFGIDSSGMRRIVSAAMLEAGEARRRAEWALWCLLGPDESRWVISLGAWDGREPFIDLAQRKWVDQIVGWDDFRLAIRLTRSQWPELREVGAQGLNRMLMIARVRGEKNAGDAERRMAAEALADLRTVDANNLRRQIDVLRVRNDASVGAIDLVLNHYEDPRPEVRAAARQYWESLSERVGVRADVARILARLAVKGTETRQELILKLLHKSADEAFEAALAEWIEEVTWGNARALESLKRWKLDESGVVKVARQIAELPSAGRTAAQGREYQRADGLRYWLCVAIGARDKGVSELTALLRSDDPEQAAYAARFAAMDVSRFAPQEAVHALIREGVLISPKVLRELKPVAEQVIMRALIELKAQPSPARLAALHVMAELGTGMEKLSEVARPFLKSESAGERKLAAEIIGTDEARRTARLPELFTELRDKTPDVRIRAAYEAERLGVDRPEIVKALVRAVEARDMPVREGLVLALERAFETGVSAREILGRADAEKDPALRAYLRAARRAVGG